MNIIKSFIICLSMYSTIPMVNISWEEKSMKYIFFFLPVIGVILGLLEFLVLLMCDYFQVSSILYAGLSTALIILFTGGIHMDGYIDTIDALSSHGDSKKRQEILKDPHTGAFAIIYTVVYFILIFSTFENLYESISLPLLIIIFSLSRIFVLFLIANTKSAYNTGLLFTFSKNKNGKILSFYGLILLLLLSIFIFYYFHIYYLVMVMVLLIISSIILSFYFNKKFGGLSGDLAGFSVCIYELIILLASSIFGVSLWI